MPSSTAAKQWLAGTLSGGAAPAVSATSLLGRIREGQLLTGSLPIHPRILICPDELAGTFPNMWTPSSINTYLTNNSTARAWYQSLLSKLDSDWNNIWLNGEDESPWCEMFALVYIIGAVSGASLPAGRTLGDFRDRAQEMLDQITDTTPHANYINPDNYYRINLPTEVSEVVLSYMPQSVAMAYDWLYNLGTMSGALKQQIVDWLRHVASIGLDYLKTKSTTLGTSSEWWQLQIPWYPFPMCFSYYKDPEDKDPGHADEDESAPGGQISAATGIEFHYDNCFTTIYGKADIGELMKWTSTHPNTQEIIGVCGTQYCDYMVWQAALGALTMVCMDDADGDATVLADYVWTIWQYWFFPITLLSGEGYNFGMQGDMGTPGSWMSIFLNGANPRPFMFVGIRLLNRKAPDIAKAIKYIYSQRGDPGVKTSHTIFHRLLLDDADTPIQSPHDSDIWPLTLDCRRSGHLIFRTNHLGHTDDLRGLQVRLIHLDQAGMEGHGRFATFDDRGQIGWGFTVTKTGVITAKKYFHKNRPPGMPNGIRFGNLDEQRDFFNPLRNSSSGSGTASLGSGGNNRRAIHRLLRFDDTNPMVGYIFADSTAHHETAKINRYTTQYTIIPGTESIDHDYIIICARIKLAAPARVRFSINSAYPITHSGTLGSKLGNSWEPPNLVRYNITGHSTPDDSAAWFKIDNSFAPSPVGSGGKEIIDSGVTPAIRGNTNFPPDDADGAMYVSVINPSAVKLVRIGGYDAVVANTEFCHEGGIGSPSGGAIDVGGRFGGMTFMNQIENPSESQLSGQTFLLVMQTARASQSEARVLISNKNTSLLNIAQIRDERTGKKHHAVIYSGPGSNGDGETALVGDETEFPRSAADVSLLTSYTYTLDEPGPTDWTIQHYLHDIDQTKSYRVTQDGQEIHASLTPDQAGELDNGGVLLFTSTGGGDFTVEEAVQGNDRVLNRASASTVVLDSISPDLRTLVPASASASVLASAALSLQGLPPLGVPTASINTIDIIESGSRILGIASTAVAVKNSSYQDAIDFQTEFTNDTPGQAPASMDLIGEDQGSVLTSLNYRNKPYAMNCEVFDGSGEAYGKANIPSRANYFITAWVRIRNIPNPENPNKMLVLMEGWGSGGTPQIFRIILYASPTGNNPDLKLAVRMRNDVGTWFESPISTEITEQNKWYKLEVKFKGASGGANGELWGRLREGSWQILRNVDTQTTRNMLGQLWFGYSPRTQEIASGEVNYDSIIVRQTFNIKPVATIKFGL